ncbi:DUF947-domain-containing protein [Trichocladium antarcticum]|uniref:rRNA biogenesis protein RRP36 n=1 Tax=Trichocladium antarcticum TaxID=1450529 RepID=A0AAN6UTH1_9PEZI|nr:DUF947-domain-containing protein [Trichocladium antarcticum]
MSSAKRKVPASLLQRRVKPRYEPEPEPELDIEDDESDAPSEEGAGFSGSDGAEDSELDGAATGSGSDEENSDANADSESEEEDDGPAPALGAAQLSFGALARAQAAMGRRKQAGDTSAPAAEPDTKDGDRQNEKPRHALKKPEKRSSKHAPMEVTSKRQVTRRRDFLTVTAETRRAQPRDPRFTPLGAGAASASATATAAAGGVEEIKMRKAYAFLDEYRDDEMAQLRAAIKKARGAGDKEQLQRALLSMESRKKAQDRRDRARGVLEEHRLKEKELVRQGKTPFYLKKAEQKKRATVAQFEGMKKGQVDKAIERRRKKVAGKEKKLMPWTRRGVEEG